MTYTSHGTPKKIETVTALTDKVSRAKSMVIADYRGLKHKQLEELRKLLKKSNAELVIAKNRLFLRALGEKGDTLQELLKDTTATLFAYEDETAPLKELMKFFKVAGTGKAKGGLLGTTILSEADVVKLSTLPSREMLLGQLVRQLNAPIQGLHYALQWNINTFVWVLKEVTNNGKTN